MKRKLLSTLAACLAAVSLLTMPALADTIGGAVVTADLLHLRSEARASSTSLSLIPEDTFLLVEEKLDGWYKVLYNGAEGYVSAEYADFEENLDGEYTYEAEVAGDLVRLRSGASTDTGIVSYLNTGDAVKVLGVSGAWLKVATLAGTSGYIRSDLMFLGGASAAGTPTSAEQSLGEQIVETAKTYLGTRYVWGGMSASGFDCSGFVGYVYKLYGYSMERVAQSIYSTNGVSVTKSELQPGDLVFFGYSAFSITHVGMYIGDGQFIHASSSSTGVIISELSSQYYTNMYVGAKRIL